jgi:tol-pal system protein YbgF
MTTAFSSSASFCLAFALSLSAGSASALPLSPPQKAQLIVKTQLFGKQAEPADTQEAAEQVIRIDRLENQIRSLNGQIEQMQFDIQKLQDQLRRAQQEPETSAKGAQRPALAPPASPAIAPTPTPATGRRGDAFDPDANPNAVGAPKPLGSLAGSQPLNLNPNQSTENNNDLSFPAKPPAAAAAPIAGVSAAPSVISAPSSQDSYDQAFAAYKQSQWAEAQSGFRAFINQNPSDKLVPDALFYIGQSLDQQGRNRDAAEQYLKISTDYSKSPRAPEAMIKLGMALQKLGAKEQACATFSEALRKYPAMSASLKASADRESKRAQC